MKLSGTAALYTQLKYWESGVAATKKQIAIAEEFETQGEAPAKKVKSRKPRTPKALPYDGIIGKPNGADTEEHAN